MSRKHANTFRLAAILGIVQVSLVALVIATLYHWTPNVRRPRFRWISVGAGFAIVVWVLASLGFGVYVANFASYNETYGSLSAVVVLMLWLWFTAVIVLVGAELNAEAEHQTAIDTTIGPVQPIGERRAVKADSIGPARGAG